MLENLEFDNIHYLNHYSNDDFDQKKFRDYVTDASMYLLLSLNKEQENPEASLDQKLWEDEYFRDMLIDQLKPILAKVYNADPKTIDDDIFMIEEFGDYYFEKTSEFMKDELMDNFAKEFEGILEEHLSDGTILTKEDFQTMLSACYFQVMLDARDFFKNEKQIEEAKLQSVFLN